MKTIAIIPARGGSKGIPNKNIYPLSGKPMICYSIEAALRSEVFDRCIVTTDSPAIAEVAKIAGAEVINRPPELATDSALLWPAINHVLAQFGKDAPEKFVLLQPTSPLRTEQHIREAVGLWRASTATSVVSVMPTGHHPNKSVRIVDGMLQPLTCIEDLSKPRQILPAIYMQNGAIYGVDTSAYVTAQSLFIHPALPYVMRAEESVDVDNPIDLVVCQALLDRRSQ